MKRLHLLLGLFGVAVLVALFKADLKAQTLSLTQKTQGRKAVQDRLDQYGMTARKRLAPYFERKGIAYPPKQIVLVGLKQEGVLEGYAANSNGTFRLIRPYSILAASGRSGPKLREGDRQVPEGIYAIESLNPNSRFHLSLRINYPNEFDRKQAARDGRTKLGGDIMIHGDAVSIGCLAMGDEAAEDLFVLAADSGLRNITVILSPLDFRQGKTVSKSAELPPWVDSLYEMIRARLSELKE